MSDVRLSESTPLVEAASGTPRKRRFRARLIRGDIQGASGYYEAAMLKRDGPKVFTEGLQVFLDHPSLSEATERPERSVRDLAGRLATTAAYEGDGLYADVEVYPHVASVIEAMAGDIGMSIRACGTAEPSEDANVRGPLITSLTEAMSVDFVTAAGAGGRLVQLLESARAQLDEAVSGAPWGDVSQGDYSIEQWRRACLIGPDSPTDSKGDYSLPVRMPNGDVNRGGVHAAAARINQVKAPPEKKKAAARKLAALYRGPLGEDPPPSLLSMAGNSEAASPQDTAAEQVAEPHNVPAPPVKPTHQEGASMSGSTGPGAPPQGGATDISEAGQLRTDLAETKQKLAEAELQVAKLGDNARELAEAKAANETLRRENQRLIANDAARAKTTDALDESTLPEVAHEKVLAAVTGDHVPLNEAGELDEAKLIEATKAAIEAERKYLARFAEAEGMGTVRGLGSASDGPSAAQLDKDLIEAFGDLGASDSAAKLAVTGRG